MTSKLASTARDITVWLLCAADADSARQAELAKRGVRILHVARAPSGIDLAQAFGLLAREGLTRILVEGGATLAASLLQAKLVDRIAQFRAPAAIGGDGLSAIGPLGLVGMSETLRFKPVETLRLGEDVLETYQPAT